MEVKDIITNRRTELGLTMKELADMVGVSEGTISRWESGEIENMRRDKIATLAKVLNISPGVIMEWEDYEPLPDVPEIVLEVLETRTREKTLITVGNTGFPIFSWANMTKKENPRQAVTHCRGHGEGIK